MTRLIILTFLLISSVASAAPTSWQHIPVVHEGRSVHLKTFAHLTTQTHNIQTEDASHWLFKTVFSPDTALQNKTIYIPSADTVSFLGLPARTDNLYSAKELPSYFLAAKERIEELKNEALKEEIQAVQRALNIHYELAESFTPFFAFASLSWADIPEVFHPKDISNPPRFADLLRHRADIKQTALDAVAAYGTDFSRYPQHLQKVAYLSFAMDSLTSQGRSSKSLRIVPDLNGSKSSPWQSILNSDGTPERRRYFAAIEQAVEAYQAGDTKALEQNLKAFASHTPKLHVESLYHSVKPLTLLILLTVFGISLSTIAALRNSKAFYILSSFTLYMAASLLALTLFARMYIMGRPPVGTLFESILFVILVCLATALYKGWHKHIQVQLAAFIVSFLLLLLASAMAQTSAAMPLLTAVLNTQFWLTVHVLCITAGYAASLLTSLAAHGAFITPHITLNRVRTLAVWATFFTFVGTLLGGVWADQSWGRFWGWDPKENGALLLVLWLAWCLHQPYSLKISKHMQLALFSASSIIVAISWFGVNLLGVGLHSYGFTEGIAAGLISFVILQILLILYLYRKASHEA